MNEGIQQLIAVALLLAVWSWAAETLPGTSINAHYVSVLLIAAAALRLFAARLPFELLMNATLAIDAYAITVFYGEHRRQQQRSPRRDALLFAASLPLERALQSRLGNELMQAPLPIPHS